MASEKINVNIENVLFVGEIIGICEDDKKQTLRLSFLPHCVEIQIDDRPDVHLHDHFIFTADIILHAIERAKNRIDIDANQCISWPCGNDGKSI